MTVDPLSHVLGLSGARCDLTGRLVAAGGWAVRYPASGRLKLIFVRRGECAVAGEGIPGEVAVRAGDAIALSGAGAVSLRTDPDVAPIGPAEMTVPLHRIGVDGAESDGAEFDGAEFDGAEFDGIAGQLRTDPGGEELLRFALPPLLHVPSGSPQAEALRWLLAELDREADLDRPGGGFARDQLAQLVLLQTLRAYLARPEALPAGWLRALADERLAPALRAMHERPGRPWRLDELGRIAALSRTSFAARFREVAGMPPLTYLHQWRMRLARHALLREDVPVGELARRLGYSSEGAFSTAFTRYSGLAPSRFRRAGR